MWQIITCAPLIGKPDDARIRIASGKIRRPIAALLPAMRAWIEIGLFPLQAAVDGNSL
jgi:hypothetical protein